MSDTRFEEILERELPTLSADARGRVIRFRDLLLEENAVQNLTRLTEPRDFFEGHLLDVIELLQSGVVGYPALDLGSGGGVPGLLAAVVDPKSGPWVLSDSEGKKADFLERAARELGFSPDQIRVHTGRAEDFLKTQAVDTIVARAVGPVGRIFNWIRDCSTWNNLVLLKGPKWDEEWGEFHRTGQGKKLRIAKTHEYSVGVEAKRRLIIRLERLKRS